jgi:hypothetical protein
MLVTSNENRLLWALRDMVAQHCSCVDPQGLRNKVLDTELVFDSGYIRCNRTAMEILVEHGHMELVSADDGGGRWYRAKMISPGNTPNAFGRDITDIKETAQCQHAKS